MQYLTIKIRSFAILFIAILCITGCKDKYAEMVKEQKALDENFIKAYLEQHTITNATRTESGLYYIPVSPGTGAQIQKNNLVTAHYISRYLNGQKITSTYDLAQMQQFRVGVNQIQLKGLDEGLQLLRNKEKATLIIPSHLAYGRSGGNAILIYELDIQNVQ